MLNNIKSNFLSAVIYLKEFSVFYSLLFLTVIIEIEDKSLEFVLLIILTVFTLLLILMIGSKRRKELEKIKTVISGIRTNRFLQPGEIILTASLKELQNEIQQMFEKAKGDIEYLKKLERMRKEFLANVSHELRTPIFTIHGYLETLMNGAIDDPKVNKSFLEKANNHTVNLSNLLNDLIDISMIESGEMRMSFRYFDLIDFVKKQIDEMKHIALGKNLELKLITTVNKLSVFGDKEKLKQVFVNLIQNAIKYTEAGSVEIIVEDEGKFCRIRIKDTGIGIPEEDINRIFERFYRVDKARSRAVGGTGLGLAIVKHIVEAHDSKIEVKSKLNEGTEFSFRLKK